MELEKASNIELIQELKNRLTGETTEPATEEPAKKLYPAVCSICGAQTEVPFKPSGFGTIKCRPCFLKTR